MPYPIDDSRRRETIRGWIGGITRWPASMLVVGLCTTTLTLLMQAFAYDAYQRVALAVPVIAANVFVLSHIDDVVRQTRGALRGAATVALASGAALLIIGAVCGAMGPGGLPAALLPGAPVVAGLLIAARNVRHHI